MAIARDAHADGGLVNPGTSLTWNFTASGANRLLFVGVFGDLLSNDATGNHISGVTYNGVALTEIARKAENNGAVGSDRWSYVFMLVAPATGTNPIVVSATTSQVIGAMAASYTGCEQFSQPDNVVTASVAASTSITTTLTPVGTGCWAFVFSKNNAGVPAAGTGLSAQDISANGDGHFDTNGTISGATSAQVTFSSADAASIMVSFSPVGGSGGGGGATAVPVFMNHLIQQGVS